MKIPKSIKTLEQLYTELSPPLELLTYLDKTIAKYGNNVPESIRDWRDKWRRINAGEAFAEGDALDVSQAELIRLPPNMF